MLRVPLTRDHLSAISALTTRGRVVLQVQDEAFGGPQVVRFRAHLLRQIGGTLLVIWDGSPMHRSKVVKAVIFHSILYQVFAPVHGTPAASVIVRP